MNLKRIFQKRLKKHPTGRKAGKINTKVIDSKSSKKGLRKLGFLGKVFNTGYPGGGLMRYLIVFLLVVGASYTIYQVVLLGIYNSTKFQNIQFEASNIAKKGEKNDEISKLTHTTVFIAVVNNSKTAPNQIQSMSVLQFNPKTSQVRWMFFPVDDYVSTKEFGDVKVENLYIVGENKEVGGGYKYLYESMENTLFMRFDEYIFIDSSAFTELVRVLGGVTVRVPEVYSIKDQNDRFRVAAFDSSKINLSNESVLNYFNDDTGDSESQLYRQWLLFKAIFDHRDILGLWKLSEIATLFEKNLKSNMSSREFTFMIKMLRTNLEDDSFVFMDSSTLEEKIDGEGRTIRSFSGSSLWQFIRKNALNQAVEDELARVEVLNGAEAPGAAFNYSIFFRNSGVDVIRRNNSPKVYKTTVIYVQDKTRDYADTVAALQRNLPETAEVKYEKSEFLSTGDIVVILGQDIED